METMRKVGRPRGQPKQLTTVYLSLEAINLMQKNKVNKSQFFDQVAIMTYADPERVKLSELYERKAKLEVELAGVEAQISLSEVKLAEANRIRRETEIERLVDAWYFRKLLTEGRAHGKQGLSSGYYLSVDYDKYLSDRRTGRVSDSSPPEMLLAYTPKIFNPRTRSEAKADMAAEMRLQEARA